MVSRRRLLLATLVAGASGTAGCVSDRLADEPSGNDDGDTPPDLERTADGVYRVDVDALGDRSASIDDSRQVSYAGDPDVVWGYESIAESDGTAAGPTPALDVGPVVDTADDVETLFLAPAYDADADRWTIYAYADETYYETREPLRFWVGRFFPESGEDQRVDEFDAAFTEYHDGVYRTTLEYGQLPAETGGASQTDQVFLANMEWDESAFEEPGPLLGAVVAPTRIGPEEPDYDAVDEDDPAPMVEFSFEYDREAKRITIIHEGGPAFQGEHVQVGFEGGLTETQFSGEVSAGGELTVEVPSADPGEYLSVAWRGPEQDHYVVLDRFEIPE